MITGPLKAATIGACLAALACSATPLERPKPPFFRACQTGVDGVECGTITVFEDRAAGRGRTIPINFDVARADVPDAKEALLVFAGGPGEGSSDLVVSADGWLKPVRAGLDIVFIDQRGTGGSHPLACDAEAFTHPPWMFGHVFDPVVVARCRDALSRDADLAKYTTDDAVADMDDLRQALGYERVSLYGVSYGTRMAQAYARRFPSRVRSMVIDGVVPFDNGLPVTYAASAQQAIERVWAACAQDPACHQAHPDPAADFARLLHRFDAGPLAAGICPGQACAATVGVRMSRGDFGYAVRGMLYNASAVTRLPDMVAAAAATGDVSPFAQRYWDRATTMGGMIALGHHLSVLCTEDVPFPSGSEIDAATANTFLGRYLFDEYRAACRDWPRGRLAQDFRTPVSVHVPTLVVSGFFDPVTPPAFAERVAKSLPLSLSIVAPTGSHGSATGCPRAAVLQVLVSGSIEGVTDSCREK